MDEPHESTSVSWDAIAARLEAFAAAWQRGEGPQIADHLPPRGALGPIPADGSPVDVPAADRLRHLLLVELIKLDMDKRGQVGLTRPLEEYLEEFPELGLPDAPPLDLIHEELHLARCRGEPGDVALACQRFPGRASEIRNWLPVAGATVTSSLAAVRPPSMLAPGEWIDDFEILGTLGRGAFAIVYRARQESLGRVVALKVSSERGDEARTLAQLDHPHIVRVYDRRRLTDQKLQLVYEQLLPGGSLAAVVPRVRQTPPASRSGELLAGAVARACTESSLEVDPTSGSLGSLAAEPWPVVVARLGGQIAAALAHAHAAGVLHRDVKPANVLLSASGTAHLADFNTSSLVSHPIYGPCAYFGGSLAYMSPEQLEAFDPTHERRPDDLDGRVDIYSLGVLLWELLAGRRPFSDDGPAGGSLPDRLRALIDCRRRPPAPLAPEVARSAAGLVAILEACLAGDRERRPADAAELAARLAACARPENSRLFSGRRRGFQGFATRHPLAAVAVCVLVPNMALGVFNYIYNHRLLVALYERSDLAEKLPALEAAFQKSAAWLNGIVFPAGLFFAWFFTRPISQLLRLPVAEQATAVLLRQRARRRGLWLGDAAAWVGVCEWMFAGIAFPIILAWHLGPLPSEVPLLYMQSPLACGLLAAAYPFFFTSLLVLRCFIPAALEPGEPPAEGESLALERLATRSGWYLLVAGGVPLGTLGLLVARGSTDRVALTLLTVAGLVGLVVAWWSHEAIRRDTSAILEATGPVDPLAPDSVRTSRRGSDSTRPPSA